MNGQDLINLANSRLAGYQNGVDPEALLSYLNEGKDEIWALLKNLNQEYFVTASQSTDATLPFYFAPLSTTSRQYTLPSDLRSIKDIEVASPLAFAALTFEYSDLTDPNFRMLRRDSTLQNTAMNQAETILYTRIGADQMLLAQFPPDALVLTIWYVRALPDFEAAQEVDQILAPYVNKVADYCCKKAMLGLQDAAQFQAWVQEWKQDCLTVQDSASPTNSSDPEFAQDFTG